MSTEANIEANRANAQLSTGPRTEEGKAAASRNATTHGLTAKTVLLPGEDPAEYEAFSKGMLRDFDPLNTVEAGLATELIGLQWRINRAPSLEARILSAESPDLKALNLISQYAARIKRQYSATFREFQELHRANEKQRREDLDQADDIYCADWILKRPSTLDLYGFDFTIEEVAKWRTKKLGIYKVDEVLREYKASLEQAA